MRGTEEGTGALFSYVGLEARVPAQHPLRAIREIANAALSDLGGEFTVMYAPLGRPSIPRSSCCELCCCRRFTRSARSAS
jgi:hypothetical protein